MLDNPLLPQRIGFMSMRSLTPAREVKDRVAGRWTVTWMAPSGTIKSGSIRVKLGDKVTPGQVIGLVGNSGNSSEPHLHFQLMNRNSPLASEGLPYSLPAFKVTGRPHSDERTFDRLAAPEAHHGDLPL